MNGSTRKNMVRGITTTVVMFGVSVILMMHNTWGDSRYELKTEAVIKEIARLDTELTVIDQEILFAETVRQKAKFKAIRAIFEREKEALTLQVEK